MKIYVVCFGLAVLLACNQGGHGVQKSSLQDIRWIDLTWSFSDQTLYWPNNPKGFTLDTLFEGMTEKGFYYSSYGFYAPEHGGTHLDAPVHFAAGKKSVDELSLEQLTGPAVVIDVSLKAGEDRDYQIGVEDVATWEEQYGQLPDDIIIFFRTGYGKHYPDPVLYFGTDKKGDEALPFLHFPGIHPDLAQWLVTQRKIKAVGLDTPSIDYGQSSDFMAHRILLAENIPAFENVARLEDLPAQNIYVVALPMLIKNGSGAPVRIIAAAIDP